MSGTRKIKPAVYRGAYHRQAAQLRAQAYANPATTCRRCGLTLAQYAAIHGERPARWHAGHVIDGLVNGPLAPEHARCNTVAANRGRKHRRSEDPYR